MYDLELLFLFDRSAEESRGEAEVEPGSCFEQERTGSQGRKKEGAPRTNKDDASSLPSSPFSAITWPIEGASILYSSLTSYRLAWFVVERPRRVGSLQETRRVELLLLFAKWTVVSSLFGPPPSHDLFLHYNKSPFSFGRRVYRKQWRQQRTEEVN